MPRHPAKAKGKTGVAMGGVKKLPKTVRAQTVRSGGGKRVV